MPSQLLQGANKAQDTTAAQGESDSQYVLVLRAGRSGREFCVHTAAVCVHTAAGSMRTASPGALRP